MVIWKRGLLSTPKIVITALDLMHDVLESLTGLEITIRQKPLTSARYSGGRRRIANYLLKIERFRV